MHIRLAVFCLLLFVIGCIASSGDQLLEYRACVDVCSQRTDASSLALHLRLLNWNVEEDCGYRCMKSLTQHAIKTGDRVHQFHGKWPFHRVYGIQEPASVLFSILNGVMHYKYHGILKRSIPDSYYLKRFYIGITVIGMNAWIWSSVFHTRDTPVTEKFDYFSAGLYILYALCVAVIRIFYVRRFTLVWILFCLCMYMGHVYYLASRPRFDYSYNMTACIIVGLLQTNTWLIWSIYQYTPWGDKQRRPYAWMVGLSVLLVSGAMSLEVFDFPPYLGTLDAHSLWHAATIPLAPLFYQFLLHDTTFEISRATNAKEKSS
jgi:hypothetical protein